MQSRLRIGYKRSRARLIEAMEQVYIVSRPNAMGKREVLAPKREECELMKHMLTVVAACWCFGNAVVAQAPANALTDFRAYTRDSVAVARLLFTQEVRDKSGRVSRNRPAVW